MSEKAWMDQKDAERVVPEDGTAAATFLLADKAVWSVKNDRALWWHCPKCGAAAAFDSVVEEFDEIDGEEELMTLYEWSCDSCGAAGSFFTRVEPLMVSVHSGSEDEE